MSDWDADSGDDAFVGGPARAFSDEEGTAAGGVFSDDDDDEEDETLAEMARERAEAEAKLKEGKPSKTFDEIMAERAAKDAEMLRAEQKQEEADRELTQAEQLQRMREGLKAAEEADNALTNELFGSAAESDTVSDEKMALEELTLAASKLVLLEDADYSALSGTLISKLRADGGEFVGDFLETLLGELIAPQLEAHLAPIGEMLSAAQSSAEAMEAAAASVRATGKVREDGCSEADGDPKGGKDNVMDKTNVNNKKADSVYSAFEGLGDGGGEDNDDDSDESSDDGDGDDFM